MNKSILPLLNFTPSNELKSYTLLIISILLLHCFSAKAQQVKINGTITDSLGQPIPNTNIIAKPQAKDNELKFAIADLKGQYQLSLKTGISYAIEVISLGYGTITDSLLAQEDQTINYSMLINTEQLETVVIKAKLAVIVKEDTITYRVDKFRTGSERKLRDLIKKLPGAEVDHLGNVTINGKQVTKLMVDGKDFFGGDTRLGVNNIPADAVDEVVAIDDYNEVAFMKGLNDSDQLALNIKLKKGKKRFLFGESELGGGIKKRYYFHPSLFYYSPKTTVNFIGSINNVNESPLTYRDVSRFKGGLSAFLNNPIQSSNSGLEQFSSREDLLSNKTLFGAFNFTREASEHLTISAYALAAQQQKEMLSKNTIQYLAQNEETEHRNISANSDEFSSFNKVKLRYKPTFSKDLAYHFITNISKHRAENNLTSLFMDSLNHTTTGINPQAFELSQYLRYSTQPTYKHTTEIKANYTYKKSNALTHWGFDHPVFSNIIPITPEETGRYDLLHNYSSITNTGAVKLKHFWVLNGTNHIYPIAGLHYYHQTYHSTDYQQLQNGTIHSLESAGFNNALSYQLVDPYFGFQYKFRLGNVLFRPGIIYHHYLWQVDQFNTRITDRQKGVFLPEFNLEYKPTTMQSLEFNYHMKANFADAQHYANRLRLVSFNRLYRGNANLENSLFHSFSLQYNSFNVASLINYRLNINYKHKAKSIRSASSLEGINQISTSIYSTSPENNYFVSAGGSRSFGWFKLHLSGYISLSDYARLINSNKINYNSQYYSYDFSVRSDFDKGPELILGLRQSFLISHSDTFKNKFRNLEPYLRVDYALGAGFIFKADYSYSQQKSAYQESKFNSGNASLFYRKDGSPWGFEVRVNNVFDIRYKRSHSFDQFMIYDQYTYIQPRTALFILSYQL